MLELLTLIILSDVCTGTNTLVVIPHAKKPKKFTEWNFKWWQQKMLLCFSTLDLVRFLKEDALIPRKVEDIHQVISAINAWN